jgi:hypothetical protein
LPPEGWALIAAILSLFAGPAFVVLSTQERRWHAAMNGLSLTLAGGICIVYLVPHALLHGGVVALLGVLGGGLLPLLFHGKQGSWGWLALAWGILALHAAVDGAALAFGEAGFGPSLAIAVVAHRLPVGLAVFDRMDTPRQAWVALGGLALATVLGFFGGPSLAHASEAVHGLFEGLVAGGLLHVVLRPRGHRNENISPEVRRWHRGGAVAGLGGLLVFVLGLYSGVLVDPVHSALGTAH